MFYLVFKLKDNQFDVEEVVGSIVSTSSNARLFNFYLRKIDKDRGTESKEAFNREIDLQKWTNANRSKRSKQKKYFYFWTNG